MSDLATDEKSYTYDLATPVGQVRLTISDIPKNGSAHFCDEELQAMLNNAGGVINLAAIAGLEAWSRALAASPKLYIGDFQTDPTVAAKNLWNAAVQLRAITGNEADDAVVAIGGGTAFLEESCFRRSSW